MDGYGAIFAGSKAARGDRREAFNVEKGIKAQRHSTLPPTRKSVAAFAAQSYFQVAAFAVAASLSGAAAIQTLAATPDSIGAPGQSAGAGVGGIGAPPRVGQATSGQSLPSPAAPSTGAAARYQDPGQVLAAACPSALASSWPRHRGDETGAKLAQAATE